MGWGHSAGSMGFWVVARAVLAALLGQGALAGQEPVDVLVYGGTPGGIAAALAAAGDGQRVVLVEPSARLGGLTTCGLSHSDFHSFESLTGAFLDFSRRVEAYYAAKYGADSPQVRDSFRGTFGEPKVNLAVFEAMLGEQQGIAVRKGLVLEGVTLSSDKPQKRIVQVALVNREGSRVVLRAKTYIDGTYEGDLMAKAGVAWRCGREGRDEFGESLAPERADEQLQAYNFRFVMTREASNRVAVEAPAGYRREDFVGVLEALTSSRIKRIFAYPRECIFKAQTPPLPNGKYDINDVSTGLVRLSLPGQNLAWPDGDAAARAKVCAAHLYDQVGLLYFLQNDAEVPAKFREEAREWGWCRDEFEESAHLPPQLYVREARRMQGVHVFKQQDSEYAENDARAVLHPGAIAMGDYGNNCHGTLHEGPRFGGKHSGEFYNPVPPYQIPYGTLVPRELSNLLVPVAVSSSHVGFCALRLEPIWMSLGQAAGHAAAQANQREVAVQGVDVPKLQRRLHAAGSATIYVSDVLPGHADFAAVQWWGTAGGLHGLNPMPAKRGQRGKNISSQYSEAVPGHGAELEKPLDAETAKRWVELAGKLGVEAGNLPPISGKPTRGEFIRAAWKAQAAVGGPQP